jgi:hypothetical protein
LYLQRKALQPMVGGAVDGACVIFINPFELSFLSEDKHAL